MNWINISSRLVNLNNWLWMSDLCCLHPYPLKPILSLCYWLRLSNGCIAASRIGLGDGCRQLVITLAGSCDRLLSVRTRVENGKKERKKKKLRSQSWFNSANGYIYIYISFLPYPWFFLVTKISYQSTRSAEKKWSKK